MPSLLILMLVTAATSAGTSAGFAAAGRLERPATDSVPPRAVSTPRPPFVFAPAGGPRILDPANPMRELAPGVYEGIVPVRMPDGSWQVHLDERFMLFSVARRAEGGGFAHSCVHGLDGLLDTEIPETPPSPEPSATHDTRNWFERLFD